MSALIPGEQRQAVLLDGEPLEDVDKFKCLDSMFVANSQVTEEIRSRIDFASAFDSVDRDSLWRIMAEDVDKFKYLGPMFVANGMGNEEIRKRINLARSTFSRLQSCI